MAASLVLFQLFPSVQDLNLIARSGKKIHVKRTGEGATIAFPALPEPFLHQLPSREHILEVISAASPIQESDIVHIAESQAVSIGQHGPRFSVR